MNRIRSAVRSSRAPALQMDKTPSANYSITSTARTVSATQGSTAATTFDIAGYEAVAADVVCTAVAGTAPTLDLYLEVSNDGGTTWYEAGKAQQIVGASTVRKLFQCHGGKRGRWRWDIGGSAGQSVTFSIVGYGVWRGR